MYTTLVQIPSSGTTYGTMLTRKLLSIDPSLRLYNITSKSFVSKHFYFNSFIKNTSGLHATNHYSSDSPGS